MTSQALDITKRISTMSEPEVEFIWDFLRKRRNDSLLNTVDIKLEESINSRTLSEEEANTRLEELGIMKRGLRIVGCNDTRNLRNDNRPRCVPRCSD